MICDKIIPSFYFIEMTGDACNMLIDKKFKIEKITITSNDFISDIVALHAATNIIDYVTQKCVPKKEEVELNPEFFPSLPPIKNEIDEENQQKDLITKNFDSIGDFVQSRTVFEGDNFSITSRIMANPDIYSAKKAVDSALKNVAMVSDHREITPQINIH